MLTENRKYHFFGELTLNRSHVLDKQCQPKDDKINWLFLNTEEHQFSFVYKIKKPLGAKYGAPFKVELAFTMIETVESIIEINHSYEVLRGQEIIGKIRLIKCIDY